MGGETQLLLAGGLVAGGVLARDAGGQRLLGVMEGQFSRVGPAGAGVGQSPHPGDERGD